MRSYEKELIKDFYEATKEHDIESFLWKLRVTLNNFVDELSEVAHEDDSRGKYVKDLSKGTIFREGERWFIVIGDSCEYGTLCVSLDKGEKLWVLNNLRFDEIGEAEFRSKE